MTVVIRSYSRLICENCDHNVGDDDRATWIDCDGSVWCVAQTPEDLLWFLHKHGVGQ